MCHNTHNIVGISNMNLKKFFALALGLPSMVVASAVAITSFQGASRLKRTTEDPYILTLDSSTPHTTLTSSFQDNVEETVTTALGNEKVFNFVKARASSGNYVELAPKGMIYSFGSENGCLTGMFEVTAVFTGASDTLRVRAGQANDLSSGITTCAPVPLTSGQPATIPFSNYISFIAGESGNVIQSITIKYTCEETEVPIKKLDGTYTGMGEDNFLYKMTLNNGDVTLSSMDRPTALNLSGTATYSNSTLTCNFTSPSSYNGLIYTFSVSGEFHKFSYVSKSGTGANNITVMDLYRVYDVENFQGYSETGHGWDTSTTGVDQYHTSGARNAYVCEYKKSSSDTGPVGGQGWSLMGSNDYLAFNASQGYTGVNATPSAKTVSFKCGQNEMRFFHMKAYFGMPSFIGKGSKLSFFAKGPFQTPQMELDSGFSGNMSVSVYYTTRVNGSTVNQCTTQQFYIPAESDWQEYTMDLDPNKTYYSFSITTKAVNNTGTSRYIPIDDIRIYTYSPYTPVTYGNGTPSGNFHGHITKGNSKAVASFVLALSCNSSGIARIDGVEYTIRNYTYNASTRAISITTTTDTSYIGTISGTYNKITDTITGVSMSGTKKNEISNNGSISLAHPELHWHCDGDAGSLRSVFVRRYRDGNGNLASDYAYNDDNILSSTEQYVSGGRSMRVRPLSTGAGFALAHDFETPRTLTNIDFWVYNPTNSSIQIRVRICKQPNFADIQAAGNLIGTWTVSAKSWKYISNGFESAPIYNFQILDFNGSNSSGVALYYDNISIH